MTDIKERPILFSAPMVRAILEDRKTVTRMAINPQPTFDDRSGFSWKGWAYGIGSDDRETAHNFSKSACPQGKPGDRLWVRETFATLSAGEYEPVKPAKGYGQDIRFAATDPLADLCAETRGYKWRPCIHMPRWTSRILLEITAIRVERLQSITEAQAMSEGCFFTDYGRKCGHGGLGWKSPDGCEYPDTHHPQREGWMWDKTASHEQCLGSARHAFGNLWEKVGGDWDANPWVWVIEFKQVTP